MKSLLRQAIQIQKQNLINRLIQSGIYKKNDTHLYELTLSELENEFKYIKKDSLETKMRLERQKDGLI